MLNPSQCRAARAFLGWSQRDLSARTGLRQQVIARFELGETDPRVSTISKIEEVLREAGIELLEDGGTGVKLRK